jgi:hypothetical protein
VSARDAIFEAAGFGALPPSAHELAEKQRAFGDQGLKGEVSKMYMAGINDAADLIDPEKEDR